MQVKLKKIKFIHICFFASIVFCFNRMALCRLNVDRTWDQTPQRDLQFYKIEHDILNRSAIVWELYLTRSYRPYLQWHESNIWRARVPLICFEIVEMHVPDRVLRQFSLNQHIPEPVEQLPRVDHKCQIDWAHFHTTLIDQSADRADRVQNQRHPLIDRSKYMWWYLGITRRWIIQSVDPPATYQPAGCKRKVVIFLT